ncbi:LamG-like jellyroll fold domain-containing protein [uncultured Christiangramia sp.]|uniref:LamG-like jellyroll fold domain-containing protein n=1 Tax=Christiangramia sp. 3-2217-3z TaxID=3417564 RepID=UPI00260977DC|nr:LamG-like jellyroll fold domain-containing protein [uncultured Christiangramia sp.]
MKQITIGPQLQFVLFSLLFFFSSVVLDGSELHAQTINANSTNPTCENSADGSITINVSGGTSPYTYNWTGTGVSTSAQNQSNLTQGSYTVEVTDSSEPAQSTSKTFTLNAVDNEDPVVQTKNITIQLDDTGNASITTSDIDNGSSDNCAIDSISLSKTIFDCNDIGSNSVTLTVSDKFGNSTSKTVTVNVEDNIAPIVQTKNITIQLDASGNASISDDAVNNNSTDACSSISFDTDITDFNCSNIGANSVTLTVTDEEGNSASKDATVTVEDDIAPNAIAQNITVQLDASGNASITAAEVDNGSSDNCGIKDLSLDITSFDCSNVGANNVVLTVTDVNNNSSTSNATVTVEDNIAPNAITKNITVQLDASGNASITAAEVDNGSRDNCGIKDLSLNNTNFDCNNVGANSVVLTVTDVNNNSSTANATITVEDNIAPTAIAQDITVQLDASGNASITAAEVDNGSSDNCGVSNLSVDKTNFNCSNVGDNTVILTATDVNDNVSTTTATVTVQDNIVPVINAVSAITSDSSEDNCFVRLTIPNPGATDNCQVSNPVGNRDDGQSLDDPFPIGITTITWNVTDENGKVAEPVTQEVIVEDKTLPIIDHNGDKDVFNEPNTCAATVNVLATAEDNCEVSSPVGVRSDGLALTDPYPVGSTDIFWNITDENGNAAIEKVQVVTVQDNEKPVVPVLEDITAQCSITLTPPTTTDNCDEEVVGSTGVALTIEESTTVFWIFTDSSGNSTTSVPQNIVIADTEAPVPNITNLPRKSITGCQISSIDELDIPTATDACDGTITASLSEDFEFPYLFYGTRTVDWIYTDISGNVSIQTQEVELKEANVDGGNLTGEYLSTTYNDQILITSCGEQIIIDLELKGQIGNIVLWQKLAINKMIWEDIPGTANTTNYAAIFQSGELESTYYRAVVRDGTCIRYSNYIYLRAVPPGDTPTVTYEVGSNIICLGETIEFTGSIESSSLPENALPGDTGQFSTGQINPNNPDSWLVDNETGGLSAGGNNTKTGNWSVTNPKEFGGIKQGKDKVPGIEMTSGDPKFAIAQGDITTTLETPKLDFSDSDLKTVSLEFDQAFYFAQGDVAKIEISFDGGQNYNTTIIEYHTSGQPELGWLEARLWESKGDSTADYYNFEGDNTTIELEPFLINQDNLSQIRIRWTFIGTSFKSVWVMDNMEVNKTDKIDAEIEWTEGIGDPDENPIATADNEVTITIIPDTPGIHEYGATARVAGCRTYDEEGTNLVQVHVSYPYAGKDIIYSPEECGNNKVQLNAYDNRLTANENASLGAYPGNVINGVTPAPENCKNCDAPGTMVEGMWSIVDGPTNNACFTAIFSNPTHPNSTFNGPSGTYTLRWTLANGCFDEVVVTISNCDNVNFDGENDHVDFGNNYDLDGAFSLEVWVKPETLTGEHTIFSKREGDYSGSAHGYDLRITNKTVSFNWDKNGSISSPHRITDNSRWYHIALTHTSTGEYRLYIDGLLMKNTGGPAPNANNYRAILGAMYVENSLESRDFYHGWMEEFRIWNVALTQDQIKLMMNQHITKGADAEVIGEVIPVATGLNWSNLEAYYRMDNISCGNLDAYTLDGSTFKGNSGKLLNITSPQQTTAPLPYESSSNGNWDSMSTWLYPDVWDAPNSKGINDQMINWNIVVAKHNITNATRNINLLGLVSQSGTIEFDGTTNTNTGKGSGNGLLISRYLQLDGVIDLNGESQLIQPEGSIIAPESSGNLQIDQQGKANSYNYNYWTSPVSNTDTPNLNGGFALSNVLYNGANPFTFQSNFHAADGNDIVISSYWLYTFSGDADDYFTWLQFDETFKLEPGIGYSMKGTSGAADLNVHQNYTFRGMPNNGDISLAVGEDQNLLTGNPYPSAIDSEKFIEDNAIQQQNFNGSLYFWDHFGKIDSHYLEEYVGGYAVLNKSGSVSSASSIDSRIQTETDLRGSKKPGRYIPVGQGFFINTQGASNPQQITFKNKYRVFVPESSGDSQFHSQEEDPKKSAENEYEKDTRHKIRLKLESPKGYHRQILATADVNTTDGFDLGYDAPLIENNVEDLYWMIDETEFVIQGVPDFNKTRVLPIGFKIAEAGEYTIKIDELENIQNDIDIYLLDTTNEEYHDLMKSDYTVSTDSIGVFNEKYQIVFQKLEEEVSEEVVEEKPEVIEEEGPEFLDMRYLRQTDEIALYNPDLQNIDFVELYSVSGQKIMTFREIPTEESISLRIQQKLSSAVYIVKIYVGDKSYSKKVIITK